MKRIIKLLTILMFVFFLFSCGNQEDTQMSEEEAQQQYNEFIKDVKDEYLYNEVIVLNENDKVTYSFDKPSILENLRIVTKSEVDRQLKLLVDIDKYHFEKTITIKQDLDLLFDKALDYISSYISTDDLVKNLNLQKQYYLDKELQITYISNHPEFINNEGKRIDHEFDEEVIITCTVSKGGQEKTKDFKVMSMGIDYNERYSRTLAYFDDFFENTAFVEGTILPTELPNFGGRFRWLCDDPTVIYDYKTIHLPKEAKTTHLLVEVVFGSTIYQLLQYEVNLPKRPDEITDEIYVKTFYETMINEMEDYVVLYNGHLPNISEKIVDIDTCTEHLFTYKTHQPISQAKLDALFYEGYTVPNEYNVVWIVVHETGVSYAGRDAKFFADAQWDKAYGNAYNDQCSWHFTVDDHSIWQSYDTKVPLWHAADGHKEGGGNVNGIGIEMCINSDSNFELSIRNNARLMASLLIEYNLGMINMRRHHDFYAPKICPQTLIHEKRWYEYLTLIEREYISQTILSNLDIQFEVSGLEETAIQDVYHIEDSENVEISVTINGHKYIFFDE